MSKPLVDQSVPKLLRPGETGQHCQPNIIVLVSIARAVIV